jgi:cytochrome d ubiquinol oxidase subunit I
VAAGSNLSALWILIANGWMQNPVGAAFNPQTMRMEIVSVYDVLFNPVAQAKFVHTVSASYVTAAIFVLGVSAWYLLRGRHRAIALRSMAVASSFGLASALSVVVLGDESGYTLTEHQKMKIAAMEGMWHTEPAPAGFTVVGIPDQEARETRHAIRIPWVFGLIATRSLTQEVPGITELVAKARGHVEQGIKAYDALQTIRATKGKDVPPAVQAAFEDNGRYLGYAYLLKRYVDDPRTATAAQIDKAAWDTVPTVWPLFWSFRIMVALGFYFILLTATFFALAAMRRLDRYPGCSGSPCSRSPAVDCRGLGWFVAEHGRQPWAIDGVLPTAVAVSNLGIWEVALTLLGFVVVYSILAVVEVALMLKYIRLGPDHVAAPQATAVPAPAE